MLGIMQDHPLLISSIITHAERFHSETAIVSRRVEGDLHRTDWGTVAKRAKRMARALDTLAIAPGSRVATLAWNGYRHLETYFGVSGSQRVLHTLNPRLSPQQLAWIVNHAGDEVVCFDTTFLPLIEAVCDQCPTVKHWIAYAAGDQLPATTKIKNLLSYEALLEASSEVYEWPVFDEQSASSMCYTSGTTGNPKGVLYSHR
ncbi:MAG: AMP-binding protein, partial [Burkholderiaceae bacterium]